MVVALSTVVAVALALRMPMRQRNDNAPRRSWLGVATWLIAVSGALLLVGVVSHTVRRHVIQIVPLVVAFALTARHSRFSSAAATSLFTFWILVMGGIWLFLLGIAPVSTGRYSPAEVVLTASAPWNRCSVRRPAAGCVASELLVFNQVRMDRPIRIYLWLAFGITWGFNIWRLGILFPIT